MEDYELEVEGSLNSSSIASDARGMCRRSEMEVKGYGLKIQLAAKQKRHNKTSLATKGT